MLCRETSSGLGRLASQWLPTLEEAHIEAVFEPCGEWIPAERSPALDRLTTKRLNWIANGRTGVHAWGYRVAAACGLAFGTSKPWGFSALHPVPEVEGLRQLLKTASWVSTPSTALAELLRKELGKSVTVVPPHAEVLGSPQDDADSGWVATIGSAEEGDEGEVLAEALRTARHRLPNLRWFTDGALRGDLEYLSPEARAQADLFVLPYRGERFSVTAFELLCEGRPLVLRHSESASAFVEQNHTGFLFESDGELGATVADAMQLSMLRQTMASSARVKVETEYTRDETFRALTKLFGLL